MGPCKKLHLLGGGPSHWALETVWDPLRDSVTCRVCRPSQLYPQPQESAASGLSLPGFKSSLHLLQATFISSVPWCPCTMGL